MARFGGTCGPAAPQGGSQPIGRIDLAAGKTVGPAGPLPGAHRRQLSDDGCGSRLFFSLEGSGGGSAAPGAEPERGSSKADVLLHGFGLPNLRRAVKKYGGERSTVASDDRFVLKVLRAHSLKQPGDFWGNLFYLYYPAHLLLLWLLRIAL